MLTTSALLPFSASMTAWNTLPSGSAARIMMISSTISPPMAKGGGRLHGLLPLLCLRFWFRGSFQPLETLITDDVLDPAGVPFSCCRVHASGNQPVGKETMLFIDLLRHFSPYIGEMQKIALVHRKKASVPQGRHRIADAGLCDLQVPGDIYRAHHAFLPLEHQNGLQVILSRCVEFHGVLPSGGYFLLCLPHGRVLPVLGQQLL